MYLTVLLLLTVCQPIRSEFTVGNDDFYGFFGRMFQRRTDESGRNWEYSVQPNKLELLRNDAVYPDKGWETCKEKNKIKNKEVIAKNMTFEEIAKSVGFNHVHRDSLAVRPHCQFDFVFPSRGNFTSRMSNELCVMEMLTAGAAVGDYDNDGLDDIFFTVYNTRSLLYRNNGDGTFTDVTVSTNVGPKRFGNGAGWIDVDSDGDLDLYVTTVGDSRHYLYVNQGGHFTEEAIDRGLSLQFSNNRKLAGFTPNFGDFDQDGFLDVYVSEWTYHSVSGEVSASRLFKNMGLSKPGYFVDVTDSAGVNMDGYWKTFRNQHGSGIHTFGSSFTDFDNDGWPELFITGDFGQSKLFWNNKNGTFSECTTKCGVNAMNDGMGHTIADINNDGYMDAFITALTYSSKSCALYTCAVGAVGNALYENHGNRNFTNTAIERGVRDGHWAWGASFLDFDNDGFLDIVSTNGFDSPSTTLDDEYGNDNMQLFHNQGEGMSNKMIDVALERGMKFYGLGRGLLIFDFDNDGDEDIVVAANVGPPKLFENKIGNKNSWLRVRVFHKCLTKASKLCDSYGARVLVTSKLGKNQTSMIGSKTHFLGQSEIIAHFGLGTSNETVAVDVYWPTSKKRMTLNDVAVNQVLRIVEPETDTHEVRDSATVKDCPKIKISQITTQPTQGFVKINEDGMSVAYHPGNLTLFDIGVQHFKYSVGVPFSISQNVTLNEGTVTLDFRVTPNIYPACKNGRQIIENGLPDLSADKRRLDGLSNNRDKVYWGATKEDLLRFAPHRYADNVSEPAGACTAQQTVSKTCPYPMELSGIGSNRPSPRLISNTLMSQFKDHFSKRNLSDFTMHYGQFLVHDTDHSSPLPRFEFQYYNNHVWMPITIPKGDVHFDPYNTGKETMPFVRSTFNRCTGQYPGKAPRSQFNAITAYLDANMVYGVDLNRCSHLREYKNGRLRIGPNLLPPKNEDYLANENPLGRPAKELFMAGDIRANVQPGLMALHALFIREHNRLAHQHKLKNPLSTDEETFQKARRMVIAEIQSITYNEYLPAILGGSHHIPKYTGYKSDVNSGITNEFATAAFRFGHSQVNTHIFRLQKDGSPIKEGHALLRDVYFKPNRLEMEGGVDPVFRGAVAFPAQEIDLLIVDEMRNTLFPTTAASPAKQTGFDLASLNIQRGRDHGLADYNTVRKNLGLKEYKSFSEITTNKDVVKKLKSLYKDINNIDLWVGGLGEDHVEGSELGETFHTIIVKQFTRIRDGDRFWYKNILTKEEIKDVEETTLGKIIRLNTGFEECPDNVFFSTKNCIGVEKHQCVPKLESNEIVEVNEKNRQLKDEVEEKDEKLKLLIILLGVISAVCLLVILISVKIAKTKGKTDKGQIPCVVTNTQKKDMVELGEPNYGAEA